MLFRSVGTIAMNVVNSSKDLGSFEHHFDNVFVAVHLGSHDWNAVKYENVHLFLLFKKLLRENYPPIFTKSKQFCENIFIFFVSRCFL